MLNKEELKWTVDTNEAGNFIKFSDGTKKFVGNDWGIICFLHEQYRDSISKIDKAVEEAQKAFGGCTKCFGKGYHTNLDAWRGTDEWDGKEYSKSTPYYNPCTCDRGKQIEGLQNKAVEDRVKEILGMLKEVAKGIHHDSKGDNSRQALISIGQITLIKNLLDYPGLQINNNKDIEEGLTNKK